MSKNLKMEFMPTKQLETAVLFLVFNRPDTTQQVFNTIRQAKPPRLYVAADGARIDKVGEVGKIAQVREISTQVDWECEVKTHFNEDNLGCGRAVSSAITWFFDNEEQGIILEDDCLPNQSFFWFCEELLNRYRDDNRITVISGRNHFGEWDVNSYSYLFSKYSTIWGWATWRRAWSIYDFEMRNWNDQYIRQLVANYVGYNFFKRRQISYEMVFQQKIDTWDYQWAYCQFCQSGITIIPKYNLIRNIGFSVDATHTTNSNDPLISVESRELSFPLIYTNTVIVDAGFDKQVANIGNLSILKKLSSKLSSVISRLM